MTKTATYLETLVRETRKSEAEIVAMAFETGLRQLWRERILGLYLRGDISRDEAIESAGIDWVELADPPTCRHASGPRMGAPGHAAPLRATSLPDR